MKTIKTILFCVGTAMAICSLLPAATAPDLINYQGVLRDSSDAPLDGDHDMVFRFWSHETAGDEIIIDTHDSANGNPVAVSGGLFNVTLGGGVVSDGSGPGGFVTLKHVFRDYGDVWLEISVDGETLAPRLRVISAAYAINADHLDGITSENFLRSNESDSFTFGTLTVAGGSALQVDGDLQMNGPVSKATTDLVSNLNADLLDGLHSSAFAGAGHTHAGSDITSAVSEASNADALDGNDSSYFINTSSAAQTKSGPLTADASAIPGEYGMKGYGWYGGYFESVPGSAQAYLGNYDTGILATGNGAGGQFHDSDQSGYAYVGVGDRGIEAIGTDAGGYFYDMDDISYAYIAHGDIGVHAYGSGAGGYFADMDDSGYAQVGIHHYGINAGGNVAGGHFFDLDNTGQAWVAYGDYGIEALGSSAGGHFTEDGGTGEAWTARSDTGIDARGVIAGGHFSAYGGAGEAWTAMGDTGVEGHGDTGGVFAETGGLSTALAASGGYGIDAQGVYGGAHFNHATLPSDVYIATDSYGIEASGNTYGGHFTGSGAEAWLCTPDYGIDAAGYTAGAVFSDNDDSAWAGLAHGDIGIEAYGSYVGGYFNDSDGTGSAHVGYDGFGILGSGGEAGGYFEDINGSAVVWVGRNDDGISSYGDEMGGFFQDSDSGTFSRIAYGGYGINSNGTKNFVQNHPYDKDKVVVYSSLEGDEVGTYTRGTARLENGTATVQLGDTFKLVTNPDIGLTVHLTPVGEWSDLYVIEKSTEQIVVGSRDSTADAAFDYIVLGLRIGFEETAPIHEKDGEAYIPSMAEVRRRYERSPELRAFNAFERYKKMVAAVNGLDEFEPNLEAAMALRAAIQEYDPDVHGPLTERLAETRGQPQDSDLPKEKSVSGNVAIEVKQTGEASTTTSFVPELGEPRGMDLTGPTLFPVSEIVEPGDLLVLDPEFPGQLRRAVSGADPAVIGIAADDAIDVEGVLRAAVTGTGFAVVKVDAGYGAVRAGDLLTSSPTPGHAMVATAPVPGTVIGKATEPLEYGTGVIRVLVTIR